MTELAVVKRLEIEILGPESPFVVARSERRKEWLPIVESAKTLEITDAESKETAVGYGRLLQASQKELEKLFTDTKQLVDALKKPVLEAEKADLGAIKTAKDALGAIVQKYNAEQDRLHREALRKAQEEARKAAEEQRLAEAIAAEAAGEKEEAEQILNERPMMAAPVIVQKSNAKLAGEVGKTTYSIRVTSLEKLVKAVAAGTVPLFAIKADESWIGKQANAYREGLSYPGVEVDSSTKTHFRS
jgi:galactokinase